MRRQVLTTVVAIMGVLPCSLAKPIAPGVVCETFPLASDCQQGQPACTLCHTTPPARNPFGLRIETELLPGVDRPLSSAQFSDGLVPALLAIAEEDTDGDGYDNETELVAGTAPGDPAEFPGIAGCSGESVNPQWDVCGYDRAYVFRKVSLDVCGYSPSYEELQSFKALFPEGQDTAIEETLQACLDTNFWRGRDGVVWRLAHRKIRPLSAIKSGPDSGAVPLADYDEDYALFLYTQTDDNDARLTLTADFFVTMSGDPPNYQRVDSLPSQRAQRGRRAGMITTRWFAVINTMFTPVPRTSGAQAYRAYLGLDIAKSEGLIPPEGQTLIDYDSKGITQPECAVCHTTLDPLTYPFTRYNGIHGGQTGAYVSGRLNAYDPAIEGAGIREVPEAGFLFGVPVANLTEWAQVAANSDAFAQATVTDYWQVFMGHKPTPSESAEFEALWRAFKTEHNFRVERMLLALIRTEAYGVP